MLGKPQGYGIATFHGNKDDHVAMYEGQFKGGYRHGEGMLINLKTKQGTLGIWEDDSMKTVIRTTPYVPQKK